MFAKRNAPRLSQSLGLTLLFLTTQSLVAVGQFGDLADTARDSLDRGVRYFHSINSHGGYVYYVTPDLAQRWGEGKVDADTIEVQPPGTPAVGMAFLRAYHVTQNSDHLQAAQDAAMALVEGQNDLGGWGHTIRFGRPKANRVSFDDDQTQSAIRFLMALDQVVTLEPLSQAIDKALSLMLASQLDNGGWPHMFPARGDYHDYATFNDQGINRCIQVMIEAVEHYDKPEHRRCLAKVGRFLMISHLPPPQPGWAQQYNEFLQPAWARDYEPPAVCPHVTVNNLLTLMDLHEFTGQGLYLKPIPDALRWLDEIRLPNGLWARFVELGTGDPLYYDRDRIRVPSTQDLHIERRLGYGYENDLSASIQEAKDRFRTIRSGERKKPETEKARSPQSIQTSLRRLAPAVRDIIEAQDAQGSWITRKDRFKHAEAGKRWNGEYAEMDRISSAVFIRNINRLAEFLELAQQR